MAAIPPITLTKFSIAAMPSKVGIRSGCRLVTARGITNFWTMRGRSSTSTRATRNATVATARAVTSSPCEESSIRLQRCTAAWKEM